MVRERWDEYKVHYIVIIIVVVGVIWLTFNVHKRELRTNGEYDSVDGNGESHYLGRGDKSESIEVLLNRIQWSAYLERRTSFWARAVIATVIIVILIMFLVYRDLPKPTDIVIMLFVVFIPLYAINSFFYVHSDMYNDFYIKNNASLIQDKLGLHYSEPPEPVDPLPPDRPYVM